MGNGNNSVNQEIVLEDYSAIYLNDNEVNGRVLNGRVLFRCFSGFVPTVPRTNDEVGDLYFNNILLNTCNGFVEAVKASDIIRFPGVLNIPLCGSLNTSTEGVYTCRLMNSSMMYQNVSVGVYFSGRSE